MTEVSETVAHEAQKFRNRGWTWKEIGDAIKRTPTETRKAVEALERQQAREAKAAEKRAKSKALSRANGTSHSDRSPMKLDEIQEAKKLRIGGWTWAEIAGHLSRSETGVRRVVMRMSGGTDPISKEKLAAIEKARAEKVQMARAKTKKTDNRPKARGTVGRGGVFTEEMIERARQLRLGGMSWNQVAEKMGTSIAISRKVRQTYGGDPLGGKQGGERVAKKKDDGPEMFGRTGYTKAQVEEAAKVRRMGKSWREVEQVTGHHRTNIARAVKKLCNGDPYEMALALGEIDLSHIPAVKRPRRGPRKQKKMPKKTKSRREPRAAREATAKQPKKKSGKHDLPGEVVVHLYGKELLSLTCSGEDALAVIALLDR